MLSQNYTKEYIISQNGTKIIIGTYTQQDEKKKISYLDIFIDNDLIGQILYNKKDNLKKLKQKTIRYLSEKGFIKESKNPNGLEKAINNFTQTIEPLLNLIPKS